MRTSYRLTPNQPRAIPGGVNGYVVDRLRRQRTLPASMYTELPQLFESVKRIGDPEVKCRTVCRYYILLHQSQEASIQRLLPNVCDLMFTTLDDIDVAWEKVRIGFEAATLVAPYVKEVALNLLSFAEGAKRTALLQTETGANAYIGTILLAISAFEGLLPRSAFDDNDIRRLGDLIDRLPSDGERAGMWSELALRARATRQSELCQRIVNDKVRPLIYEVQKRTPFFANGVVASVAPSLYAAFPVSAREDLAHLPSQFRDLAYARVCRYIFSKHTAHQPYDTMPNPSYDITYDEAIQILEICSSIDQDDITFSMISDLGNSIANAPRSRFTRDQVDTLIGKIDQLGQTKFPNPRFIVHNGYSVSVRAIVGKLRKAARGEWDKLAADARVLPNQSDRVFVLCIIANSCRARERALSRQIIEEAYKAATTIPCVYDRVARIKMVAIQAWEIDAALARSLLESGMRTSLEDGGDELWPLQRDMLDFAHRVDPEYAAKLAALADTDPARLLTRHSLRERLSLLNTARSLVGDRTSQGDENEQDDDAVANAAWRLLGQLNAGRIANKKQEGMREYVKIASTMPFLESYPILAWVVGNAVNRFADTDMASKFLRSIFEATLLAAQIAARIADQNSRVLRDAFVGTSLGEPTADGGLIRAGERDIAISRIRSWLENQVKDTLLICDQFFGPDDLEILTLVLSICPTVKVRVLTSLKHHILEKIEQPYQESYCKAWRSKFSDQDPPDTEVVIIGIQSSKESPIHDRWWLSDGAGLRMGTSFRSLGVGKDSELNARLSSASAVAFEANVRRYLSREVREHKGEKLSYLVFTLD